MLFATYLVHGMCPWPYIETNSWTVFYCSMQRYTWKLTPVFYVNCKGKLFSNRFQWLNHLKPDASKWKESCPPFSSIYLPTFLAGRNIWKITCLAREGWLVRGRLLRLRKLFSDQSFYASHSNCYHPRNWRGELPSMEHPEGVRNIWGEEGHYTSTWHPPFGRRSPNHTNISWLLYIN